MYCERQEKKSKAERKKSGRGALKRRYVVTRRNDDPSDNATLELTKASSPFCLHTASLR